MRKKQFKILKNKLIERVSGFGVTVRISNGKFKRGNSYGVSGLYSSRKKRINVVIRGRCSYLAILATLAHEIRHAEHHSKGLFPDYYDPVMETKEYRTKIKDGLIIPPPVEEGQKAENDCDLFAVNWLKSEGYPLDRKKKSYQAFFKPYPIYNVFTYHLHRLVPKG